MDISLKEYLLKEFYDGGGVGIGYALHAGQVTVADGTDEGGTSRDDCTQK